jgi:nitrate reductase NapAB chaperone NapD
MKLASLLLSVRPGHCADLRTALTAIPGVRVHDELAGPKLVVTVEDGPDHELLQSLLAAQSLPDVLCSTLTYEYCDDDFASLEKRQ